jgi:hypothetical protein
VPPGATAAAAITSRRPDGGSHTAVPALPTPEPVR